MSFRACLLAMVVGPPMFLATAAAPQSPAAAVVCPDPMVVVSKVTVYYERLGPRVTGIVRHSCRQAVGIELKWTMYETDGSVIFSDEWWPASAFNIPPNTDYAFDHQRFTSGIGLDSRVEAMAWRLWP